MNVLSNEDNQEFLNWMAGRLPAQMIHDAYQEFQLNKTGRQSFQQWFRSLGQNPAVMSLLEAIYKLDEEGKARDEMLVLNIVVKQRIPKDAVKRRQDPITTDEIIEFYKHLQK